MALKDKLVIEISAEQMHKSEYHYADLILPATDGQIEDAMQRARAVGREGQMQLNVLSCPKLPELADTRLDAPTIKELNFLAQRLEKLTENQLIGLNALFETQKEAGEFEFGLPLKDLINMTYDLDGMTVVPGLSSDRQLGEFVRDNEMEPYMQKMTNETLKLLDLEKVGKKFRESECGVYSNGHYVARLGYCWPEVYDGENLPEPERKAVGGGFIQMLIAKSGLENPEEAEKGAVLIGLPIDTETANTIAQAVGEGRIEDTVYFDFQSPLSWLTDEVYTSNELFGKLNNLAFVYETLSADDKLKFKAVTEGLQCRDLDVAKEIINNLDKYQISHYTPCYETYAKVYMQINLPTDFDISILEGCNLANLGRRLCDRLDCKLTDYGIISKENGQIFAIVTPEAEEEQTVVQAEEPEQEMGGMQM